MSAELLGRSASELTQDLAARRIRATELMAACLARVEKVNPALNAICTVDGEAALAAAADCDRRLESGVSPRALEGIPFLAKDNRLPARRRASERDRRQARRPLLRCVPVHVRVQRHGVAGDLRAVRVHARWASRRAADREAPAPGGRGARGGRRVPAGLPAASGATARGCRRAPSSRPRPHPHRPGPDWIGRPGAPR